MNYTKQNLDPIQVCGIPMQLTKSQKQNYQIITQHWKAFNKKLWEYKTNNSTNWVKYALTCKNVNSYFYMPCIPYNELVPFKNVQIEGGWHAIFEHKGNIAFINKTLHHLYRNVIPNSPLKINPERKLIHYERYDQRFNWNNPSSVIEICIPLINTD